MDDSKLTNHPYLNKRVRFFNNKYNIKTGTVIKVKYCDTNGDTRAGKFMLKIKRKNKKYWRNINCVRLIQNLND